MIILKRKKLYVIYKEYRNWEDSDSNGAEIIELCKNKKHALKILLADYYNELNFFNENNTEIDEQNSTNIGYYIETKNGDVEGYIVEKEVA